MLAPHNNDPAQIKVKLFHIRLETENKMKEEHGYLILCNIHYTYTLRTTHGKRQRERQWGVRERSKEYIPLRTN